MNLTISSDIQQILFNTYDVQKLIFNSHLVWEKSQYDYSQDYLTFEILTNGAIPLTNAGGTTTRSIQYSKNGGSWTSLNFPGGDGQSNGINGLKAGDKVRVKGTVMSYGSSASKYLYFGTPSPNDAVCEFNLSGNIMSLYKGDSFKTATTISNSYLFLNLFKNSKCRSAEHLILPATTLATYCYYGLFSGSTLLTKAPALPATTLSDYCYQGMFTGCTALTTAPTLNATTLAQYCYANMFVQCSSLINVQEILPATTLKTRCYQNMFGLCTALTTSPIIYGTTLANYCCSGMFTGCTALTTGHVPNATSLATGCYQQMFQNCTSLTTAPVLPATSLSSGCYNNMFNGCSKLNYIKAMFTTTPSATFTNSWVNGVASTGTFVKNSSATWNVTGANGVPSGWTVQTASS